MDSSEDILVSVVIPTVKYDGHTHQAVLSIFAQHYQKWEIILVLDGGSLSDVPEEIREDRRIRIVEHKEQLGTPTSLNDGVGVAKGEYIARLDADDVAHPDRLRKQIDFLTSHGEVCCIGANAVLINDATEYMGKFSFRRASEDIRLDLLRTNQLIHSSVMYRKNVFEQIGGYRTQMIRMQDYDLFLRFAAVAPIAYSNEVLCAYRVHPGQHSRKTSPFRKYTFEILRQRMILSSSLGTSKIKQFLGNAQWYIAQILRFSGARKPGYLAQSAAADSIDNLDWLLNPK